MTEAELMKCPQCGCNKVFNNGHRTLSDGSEVQRFKCAGCSYRFSENLYAITNDKGNNQICAKSVKNLDAHIGLELLCAGDENLLNYAWLLKKKRQNADNTIELRVRILKQLKKVGADLRNPDTVETILAVEPLTKAQKYQWKMSYRSYCRMMNIHWEAPRIKYEPKEPFIPTLEELSALIHASSTSKGTATFLQVALTTGARCGEICKLKWTDVNSEDCTISINEAEKGSRNRTVKVPAKTIAMISALPKKYDPYIFSPNPETMRANLCNLKKKLADVQQNPRFLQIHLHTFRHFFGREMLRQTKNLQHVQYLLGHKSIVNTERYTHMVHFESDKYYSSVATTLEELKQLAEDGWTYFQEINGNKVFRKPKYC